MPLALLLALAASLGVHVAVLIGPDVELFGGAQQVPQPLRVELQAPPPVPPSRAVKPAAGARGRAENHAARAPAAGRPDTVRRSTGPVVLAAPKAAGNSENAPEFPSTVPEYLPETGDAPTPPAPVRPVLPASGTTRFAIYFGTRGFQIGHAEQHWEFTADGRYRLSGMTETSGLVALFRSIRFENESVGRLVAGGLQPEHYRTRKNGRDGNEQVDFDWAAQTVRLASDGGHSQPVSPGAQDILSLNYQLAYVEHLERGARIGVATGRKYEPYFLEALGEESLVTPAGRFRTLHLRAQIGTRTEIWLALDHHRLPVKIRFTDKKGDVYEQVATEIGIP